MLDKSLRVQCSLKVSCKMRDAIIQTSVLVLELRDLLVLLVLANLGVGDGNGLRLGDEGCSDGLEFCEDLFLEGLKVGRLFGGD